MLIPVEKINEAKALYDGQAIKEIFEHFGYEYDGKMKGILCPFHDDKNASFIWNPKANAAHCFGCNRNYDIIDLYLDQGMTFLEAVQKLFKNVGMEYSFDERGKQNKPTYKYPKREIGYDRTKVEAYLGKRKISPKTLDYADVQADENGNIVFHYYDANDVLLNTKYRPSRKIEPGENKCWFQPGASTTPILYNMNRIDPSKPLVITEGECFKGDTEVLTPKGWIRLDQYNNEKVVQINQDLTGEFVLPISYIKKDYDGDMYYLSKGRNYSLEVTAGHNIVYVDKKGNIIKKAAKDMPKSIGNGFLPTTTTIDGNGINLSKEQIALYIAISADCTIDIRKTTRHSRFAVKKERKYLRLKGLLDALNISYFDNSNASNGYYYIGFKTPEWIKSKMFPVEWLEQATLEQRRFILDEMVYWDGNRVPNRSQVEYSSKIYEQAVWMQTMAHTCGYMSTIMKRSNKYGEWYKVSILFNKNSVSFQHGFDSIQNYKGKVYCVTVPTGMILIRHQGHISICGNCDTLSIIEAGYTNAVSVPTGAQATTWITECWDWLEQFQKIIIWSDNDSAGIKMRNECVRRLGSWRTFFVEIKDEDKRSDGAICKDANEVLYFYGKEKVLEYINSPIETPIEGVLDLAEAEDFNIESAEGLYTGIKDLDNKIYKLVFGTVTLITGLPGSGKSVFANQIGIAEALNQGYNCFVYSGELPAPILRNWVETNLIGRENITMKNELVRVLDPTARQQLKEWYKGRVILYDDSLGVTSTSLLEKMEEAVRKLGCRVITIDNLMCIDLMCNETERLEAEKNFVKDLVLFAKKFNVLIFLLAHPRKALAGETSLNLQSVSGASAIGNLCHMAFAIHRYTNKEKEGETNMRGEYIKGCEPKTYDTYIEVIKNRLTGLMPKIEVYFDFPSYRFYRTPSEVWKKYKWNKDLKPFSDTDPNSHTIVKESPLND